MLSNSPPPSATKPGGHVELAEMGGVIHCDDGSMRSDNGALRFYETLSMALERSGRVPYMLGSMMVRHLEEAGFVDVHLTKVKTPLGPWPRDAKLRFAHPPCAAHRKVGRLELS